MVLPATMSGKQDGQRARRFPHQRRCAAHRLEVPTDDVSSCHPLMNVDDARVARARATFEANPQLRHAPPVARHRASSTWRAGEWGKKISSGLTCCCATAGSALGAVMAPLPVSSARPQPAYALQSFNTNESLIPQDLVMSHRLPAGASLSDEPPLCLTADDQRRTHVVRISVPASQTEAPYSRPFSARYVRHYQASCDPASSMCLQAHVSTDTRRRRPPPSASLTAPPRGALSPSAAAAAFGYQPRAGAVAVRLARTPMLASRDDFEAMRAATERTARERATSIDGRARLALSPETEALTAALRAFRVSQMRVDAIRRTTNTALGFTDGVRPALLTPLTCL